MKIKCPNTVCNGENLDQGIDSVILCHDCKKTFVLVPKWIIP